METKTNTETTWEERQVIEKAQRKELYFNKLNKLIEIGNQFKGFTVDSESYKQRGENGFYNADHINVAVESDTMSFYLSINYRSKGKINISPKFNRNNKGEYISPYGYDEEDFSINISLEKEPNLIAKQIEKRFFPKCLELTEKVNNLIESSNDYTNTTQATMEYIKGSPLTDHEKRGSTIYPKCENVRVVEVHRDDVRLELYSVPKEKAKQIIELLNN